MSNVVSPDANSGLTPQPATAVQSLLAGMNQPAPEAPQPPPMTPVEANTSRWRNLVHGALLGLSGGLSAGIQNVMDAGTPRGPHANGFAAGQEAVAQDQQAQQQRQQQAQAAAQQQFENQLQSQRAQQESIFNRARTAEANLNAFKLAQAIDGAPKEAQDAYFKDQDAHAEHLGEQGMSSLGSFPDKMTALKYMQQSGKGVGDVVFTHHRDEDGKDSIVLYENPDHAVDSATVNKAFAGVGAPPIPDGVTMNYHDFKANLGKYQSKQADALLKAQDEARREQFEAGQNAMRENREDARAKLKANGGANGSDAEYQAQVHRATDRLANGISSLGEVTKGMGKEAQKFSKDVQDDLGQRYPDIDQKSLELTGEEIKRRDLARNAMHNLSDIATTIQRRPDLIGKIQGQLSKGKELVGTDDKDLSNIVTALDNYALASTGAHGIRAVEARADAKRALLNGFKNGPAAIQSSIETAASSLGNLAAAGTPRKKDGSPFLLSPQAPANAPTQHKVGDSVLYKGQQRKIKAIVNGQAELE